MMAGRAARTIAGRRLVVFMGNVTGKLHNTEKTAPTILPKFSTISPITEERERMKFEQ
jgi:hypothetical protein